MVAKKKRKVDFFAKKEWTVKNLIQKRVDNEYFLQKGSNAKKEKLLQKLSGQWKNCCKKEWTVKKLLQKRVDSEKIAAKKSEE